MAVFAVHTLIDYLSTDRDLIEVLCRAIAEVQTKLSAINWCCTAYSKLRNGHKLVSCDASSCGYDVRCDNEFKVFTNIDSTIVDRNYCTRVSSGTDFSCRHSG